LPFGQPASPALEAWRKLFGEPMPSTIEDVDQWQRELDDARECVYPAIANGDIQQVLKFLRACPSLTLESDELLRQAIESDQTAVREALLDAGIPATCINESGITPLMNAATEGRLTIARRLLQAGADPNVLPEHWDRKIDPEFYGESALFQALCRGDEAMIDLLSRVTEPAIRELSYHAHCRWQRLTGRADRDKKREK
jgi:ankyrin repeat protein